MKAYKGFDANMTCRGFQYAEGETYETDSAVLCETGFHACLEPMDVFGYYHPSTGAVIHEVEVADDAVGHEPHELKDSKVASTRITIGARIDIMGMVKVHLGLVWDRVAKVRAAKPDQYTSGDQSTAATSGDQSTAATSGYRSTAATSGDQSTATVQGEESIALAGGWRCSASGAAGCWLVLAERDDEGRILGVQAVKVGSLVLGERIEPGVLYALIDGFVVPVSADGEALA